MKCKICGEPARVTSRVRGTTTLMGAGAGGYAAATAGGKTGAAIGSFFCPGFGTAVGGLLGVLTGATALDAFRSLRPGCAALPGFGLLRNSSGFV